MDLTDSMIVASNEGELSRQITSLCRSIPLPGEYDPEHLTPALRKEQDSYERAMNHYLQSAMALYTQKHASLQTRLDDWWHKTYENTPNDLIDTKWENYYPALTLSDRYFGSDLTKAEAFSDLQQRYLATQLLSKSFTQQQLAELKRKAQGLVCSLDPRDIDWFPKEQLDECLEQEGLASNAAINSVLQRKPYAPVRKDDSREALYIVWTKRKEESLRRNQYLGLDWRAFELDGTWDGEHFVFTYRQAVEAFTYLATKRLFEAAQGYGGTDFDRAFWNILKIATEAGEEENYYLDPLDEDVWLGLRDLRQALDEADHVQFHEDFQSDKHSGQKWFREVGLPALYGNKDDWWVDADDIPNDNHAETTVELIIVKTRRSPLEEVNLFKLNFTARVVDSQLLSLTEARFGQALTRIFSHA